MNQNQLEYMPDNFETTGNQKPETIHVSPEILILQQFINECTSQKLKGSAITELARKKYNYSFTYKSLLNKIDAYRLRGLAGLVRKERRDKGESGSFSVSVIMTMEGIFEKCRCVTSSYRKTHDSLMKQSIKFITKQGAGYDIHSKQGSNGEPKYFLAQSNSNVHAFSPAIYESGAYITTDGEELLIGDYATATRHFKIVKKVAGDALYKGRYGLENFRLKRQRAMRLDYSRLNPNGLWSMDGKQVDILVISADGRHIFRPWLSGIERVSTRQYHHEICKSPDSEAIANAITSAVRMWGVPEEINFDRGADYRSYRVQQLMDVLKAKKRQSIRKLARSKPIESFHNILDHLLKSLPGYTGNNRDEMPQETRDMLRKYTKANKEIKEYEKMIKDGTEFYISLNANPDGRLRASKKRFLFIDEFINELNKVLDHYHSRQHGGMKEDELGKRVNDRLCDDELINKYAAKLNTPNGREEYWIEKGWQAVTTSPDAIAVFAMNAELRTVQISKGIEFRKEEYSNTKLKTLTGQQVLIRYTNLNTNELFVFHSDALQGLKHKKELTPEILSGLKYICLAELWHKIHYNDEVYKDYIIDQRREEKNINNTLGVGKVYQINGMENEMQKIEDDKAETFRRNNPSKKLKDWCD